MSDLYGPEHRSLQDKFDTRRLADNVERRVVEDIINEFHRDFIEARDMFWLASVDHRGRPTVSYKGGDPGFVRVLDEKTLAFPCYDGNGMFYSMGNIGQTAKVGMLFIDFETPRRFRVHGMARVHSDDPLLQDYTEALLVVRVAVTNAFTNCGRYIHRYMRQETSKYVPQDGTKTPHAPWKRVDDLQDVLPEKDRGIAEREGGTITEQEYRKDFWRGLD